jgi:hypothetical protein
MARILIVHGISNQYGGDMELRSAWFPALADGLLRAGAELELRPDDCFCPFYGDLFRPSGHLGGGRFANADLAGLSEDERDLIASIWRAAAAADPDVPAPEAFSDPLARAPRFAERALVALAKSKFLARAFPLRFFGDLRQIVRYFDDPVLREVVQERVTRRIGPETRIVIGHSLGSVVAYEALGARPEGVTLFVSLGSPLGIRNAVFDKLVPGPGPDGIGLWPGRLERWLNVAATGDIVAAQKRLAPLFGDRVEDHLIDSGWDAHSSTRYLNTAAAGAAIAEALSAPDGP